jgi:spermidine/putrescine transport system substrate-binding protein
VWPNTLNANFVKDFEKQNNVKVNIRYFETQEELLALLEATQNQGFDCLMASDYLIPSLREKKIITPIDKKRLSFWGNYHKGLLGYEHDPKNNYSIPYYWAVYGIAYDKKKFGDTQISWGHLFDTKIVNYPVGMMSDLREIIALAGLYLFNKTKSFSDEELQKITELLIDQKQWVELYADELVSPLLASGNCPLIMTLSSDVMKYITKNSSFDFVIPKEGGFRVIDSFALVNGSKKHDLVYKFLNYLYQPKILEKYVKLFSFSSPLKNVADIETTSLFSTPKKKFFKNLHSFSFNISDEQLDKIFITLTS